MNLCPCGARGDPGAQCSCSPQRVVAYRARLSRALLDRFDLVVTVPRPRASELQAPSGEGSELVRARVAAARHVDPVCWRLDPIAALDLLAEEDRFALIPLVYGYRNYAGPGYRRHLVRCADMPCLGDAGPRGSCLGGTGLAVSAGSLHRELACAECHVEPGVQGEVVFGMHCCGVSTPLAAAVAAAVGGNVGD